MIQYGDIKLSESGNNGLQYKAGDLVTGDAKEQQIGAILEAGTGNFRQKPTLGANANILNDAPFDGRSIMSRLVQALHVDGWRIDEVEANTQRSDNLGVIITKAEKITDNTKSRL